MPITKVLESCSTEDLKELFSLSSTESLERLADVFGDILAERNALQIESAFISLVLGNLPDED